MALTRACRAPQALSDSLRPRCVYRDARQPLAECERYQLRALVCYYGSHYASFARTDDPDALATGGFEAPPPAWTRFDDAAVTHVGGWQAVCDACARGHLQPTVLFFE